MRCSYGGKIRLHRDQALSGCKSIVTYTKLEIAVRQNLHRCVIKTIDTYKIQYRIYQSHVTYTKRKK